MLLRIICTSLWIFYTSAFCPEICRCDDKTVDCSNADLDRMPARIPANTITLNLRGNRFTEVTGTQFVKFKKLEQLILTDNKIASLEENFLSAMPSLRRLILSFNKLQNLPIFTFSHNKITSIDVSNNLLTSIDPESLFGMPSLMQFDISFNAFKTLPLGIFEKNPRLTKFRLNENPWHCDCRIRWIAERISDLGGEAECLFPEHMRNVRFQNAVPNVFECDIPDAVVAPDHSRLSCQPKEEATSVWVYQNLQMNETSLDWLRSIDDSIVIGSLQNVDDFMCAYDYKVHM